MYIKEIDSKHLSSVVLGAHRPDMEKGLDMVSYIPVISTFSGAFRVIASSVQTIVDIIKATNALAHTIFLQKNEEAKEDLKQFSILILHDLSNILKGTVEMIPVLGNLAVLVSNTKMPRFGYDEQDTERFLNFAY